MLETMYSYQINKIMQDTMGVQLDNKKKEKQMPTFQVQNDIFSTLAGAFEATKYGGEQLLNKFYEANNNGAKPIKIKRTRGETMKIIRGKRK